jgi:hypothetical protein
MCRIVAPALVYSVRRDRRATGPKIVRDVPWLNRKIEEFSRRAFTQELRLE